VGLEPEIKTKSSVIPFGLFRPSLTKSKLVPETKGLTLEQVDLIYRKSTPRQSPTYRKEILALNLHDSQTENGVQTPPDTENKVQAKIQHLDA
jgi:hypothetical protein